MGTLQVVSQRDGRTYAARRIFVNGVQVYPPDAANRLLFGAGASTEDVGEGQLLIADAAFPASTTLWPTTTAPVTTTPEATTTQPATTTQEATTTPPATTTPEATTTDPATTTPGATSTEAATTTATPRWYCYREDHFPSMVACYAGIPLLWSDYYCLSTSERPATPQESGCEADETDGTWFYWAQVGGPYETLDECLNLCASTTAAPTTTPPATTTAEATTTEPATTTQEATTTPGNLWYCFKVTQYPDEESALMSEGGTDDYQCLHLSEVPGDDSEDTPIPLGTDPVYWYVYHRLSGPYSTSEACDAACVAPPQNTCNSCDPPIPDTLYARMRNGTGDYAQFNGRQTWNWYFGCLWSPDGLWNFVYWGYVNTYSDTRWYAMLVDPNVGGGAAFIGGAEACGPNGSYIFSALDGSAPEYSGTPPTVEISETPFTED